MPETTKYNGYTNYETWNVALWIGNEQGSYNYWQDCARERYEEAEPTSYSTRRQVAARALAEALKDEITEAAPDLGSSMYSDLLGAALSEVNWDEIAGNWIEEIADEIDKEEAEAAAEDEAEDD